MSDEKILVHKIIDCVGVINVEKTNYPETADYPKVRISFHSLNFHGGSSIEEGGFTIPFGVPRERLVKVLTQDGQPLLNNGQKNNGKKYRAVLFFIEVDEEASDDPIQLRL